MLLISSTSGIVQKQAIQSLSLSLYVALVAQKRMKKKDENFPF
jgi:hypothetical protein